MFMNNFTKSSGNAYWHAITNLTCCSIDLKKTQLFKTFLVLMLFAASSTSMFAQNRTTFYEVCVADRPEGLTEEQALALFPNVECDGTLKVEKIEDLQGDDCGWVSIYEYILFCDDEQLAVEKLIYEGGDIEAPKLEIPADITVECDAVPEVGTPTATDNCDDDVEIKYDGEVRTGDDCNYTLQRTWTAIDNCGLTHTLTQTITVQDTQGPELNKGAEVPTGETGLNLCYSDLPQGPSEDDIKALFSDNCGDVLVEKVRVFKGTDCMWKGYINYYITDDCGNPGDTISLYYNGGDNEDPVFVDPPADIEVTCIDQIPANYVLQWTDNCSVSDPKEKGLGVDDTSGLGEACEGGVMTRTWTAQDACGNEVTHTQTITVKPAPPVVFDQLEDMEIRCEDLEAFEPGTLYYSNGGEGACDISGYAQGVAEDFKENCGSFTVTYTYNDTCNSIEHVQTITVIDDVKPVLEIPADITVECDEVPEVGEASATDNCDTDVTIKFDGEDRTDGQCEDSYTLTRTWTATDNCGNSTTLSQTITVQDTTKPVLTIPADETVECDNVPEIGVASATDNCDADVQVDFIEEKIEYGDDDCADTYIIFRIWKATDNCGNTDLKTQKITVQDTTAPVLTIPADETVECDAVPNPGIATAVDNCDENVRVEYNGEDRTDGECADNYTLTRTWTATDCAGNSTTLKQVITVQDTTDPKIVVPADITVECDEVPEIGEATGTDNCDDDVTIEFVDEKRIDGACQDSYTLTRTWRATDNCGNDVTGTQTITVQDTTDPILTVPADVTVECDAVPAVGQASATDNCDADVLVEFVNEDRVDGDCPNNYTLYRIWIATDNCGNTATKTQIITVLDRTKPTFTAPEDTTIYTDAECKYDASTDATGDVTDESDNCSEALEATYEDKVEEGQCEGEKIIIRTWSLMDECGNEAEDQVQIITVLDRIVPTFTAPDDITIYTDAECKYDASTDKTGDVTDEADNCSTDINATYVDKVEEGSCEGEKIITRTWSLVDNCGNAAEDQVQTITVKDNIAPTFTAPADLTIYSDENCEYNASPDVTGDVTDEADNCSTDINATYVDKVEDGSCEGEKIITRTWSLVDNCGNAAEDQVQTITVKDNIAPTFKAPADVDLDCADDTSIANTGDVTDEADNCSTGLEATYSDDIIAGDCAGNYVIKRTWSLVDNCGNAAEDQVQTITVTDTTAPEEGENFVLPPSINEINACQDDYLAPPMTEEEFAAMFTDNCSEVVVTLWSSPVGTDCGWSIIHKYSVSDDCGNFLADYKVYYSGEDRTAPELVGVPADAQIECTDEIPAPADVTAIDTCDDNVKVHLDESIVNYNCAGNYDIIRTWTATDDCDNSVSATQTIEVRDYEAPELIDGAELPEGSNENDLCAPDTDEELANLGVLTADEFATLYKDNCSGVNVNRVINLDGDDCKWIMWVRYDITDDCGNEAQSVKVWYHGGDMSAPEPTGLCENETMEILTSEYGVCPADATFSVGLGDEITATSGVWSVAGRDFTHANLMPCFMDNCTAQEDLTFVVAAIDEGSADDCPRTMTITFDVVDNCGNEYKGFVCTFVIIDDVAPVIEDCPADIVVQVGSQAPASIDGFTSLGEYNGKAYYLSNAEMNAGDALADAANRGGYAAAINDAAENTWVRDAVTAAAGGIKYWIGLTDSANEGTFVWQSGEALTYTNWSAGEPNNLLGEDCVEVYTNAKWNDLECHGQILYQRQYVLELDAPSSNGAKVEFDEPKASDNCDLVSMEQTAGLPSGSEFPIGTTTVTYTATDACGNKTECSFDVTVEAVAVEVPEIVTYSSDCWTVSFYLTGTDDHGYPVYDYGQINNTDYDYLSYRLAYNHDLGQWEGVETYYGQPYMTIVSVTDSPVPPCDDSEWITDTNCEESVEVFCGSDDSRNLNPNNGEEVYTRPDSNQAQAEDANADIKIDFTAYPVPFDRDVNVKFNFEFDTDVTINIHDTKGLLVKSLTLNNVRANSDVKKSFDLSRAGDQLFYITVTTNQGSVTKKVVSSNIKRR